MKKNNPKHRITRQQRELGENRASRTVHKLTLRCEQPLVQCILSESAQQAKEHNGGPNIRLNACYRLFAPKITAQAGARPRAVTRGFPK